jgi:hypothetical protein
MNIILSASSCCVTAAASGHHPEIIFTNSTAEGASGRVGVVAGWTPGILAWELTMRLVAAFACVVLGITPVTAVGQSVSNVPDQDIWTTSVYSYAPRGGGPGGGVADETLRIGGWGDFYYSLLHFDLTGLPKTATKIQLRLYNMSANKGTPTGLYLYQIKQSWNWQTRGTGLDRLRLWWADQPNAVPYSVTTLPKPVINSYYYIDITDLYNGWQSGYIPNCGIELRPTNNWNNFDFFASSRNQNHNWKPVLIIEAPGFLTTPPKDGWHPPETRVNPPCEAVVAYRIP